MSIFLLKLILLILRKTYYQYVLFKQGNYENPQSPT